MDEIVVRLSYTEVEDIVRALESDARSRYYLNRCMSIGKDKTSDEEVRARISRMMRLKDRLQGFLITNTTGEDQNG